jgi:hypoxanthine phosphoribosyltransferase
MSQIDFMNINGDELNLLIDKETIRSRIDELAKQIRKDHGDGTLSVLCVLNGAFVFAADLIRAYEGPCEITFVKLSSYQGTESTGTVKMAEKIPCNITGRDVLIVEDIVDTGLTMDYLLKIVKAQNPRSVKVATCFDKPSRRKINVPVDYVAFEIEDKFIVGYGLDYDGLYRNLPSIYTKNG